MTGLLRDIAMVWWPSGGQRTARRNAWASMVADSKRARERAEAARVVNTASAAPEIATTTAQG